MAVPHPGQRPRWKKRPILPHVKTKVNPQPLKRKRIGPPKETFAPWSYDQLQTEADKRLQTLMGPQQSDIERRTKAQLAAIAGAGKAAADILQKTAGTTQTVYDTAAKELAGLAGGYTGSLRNQMAAERAKASGFAALQGAPEAAQPVNPTDLSNTIYGGAATESANLIAQGAAAESNRQGGIGAQEAFNQQEIRSRMAQGEQELLDLAAKRPELRQQILDELYKREMDKFQVRQGQQEMGLKKQEMGLRRKQFRLQKKQTKAQMRIQAQAQALYEKQFGLKTTESKIATKSDKRKQALAERVANQNYKISLQRNQAAITAANRAGRQVNASASKDVGYLVDQNGNPIYRNGKKIKVKGGGAGSLTASQKSTQIRMASNAAEQMFKDSQATPGALPGVPSTPPKHKWTFQAALKKLADEYPLIPKSRLRKTLIANGIKPKGKPRRAPKNPFGMPWEQ